MKKVVVLTGLVCLTALTSCSTPKTVLKHPKTQQVVTCGGSSTGSLVGGVIGYHIEKSNDADCVSTYSEQGFRTVATDRNEKH